MTLRAEIVHLVALVKEQLRQVRAVLASDTCGKGDLTLPAKSVIGLSGQPGGEKQAGRCFVLAFKHHNAKGRNTEDLYEIFVYVKRNALGARINVLGHVRVLAFVFLEEQLPRAGSPSSAQLLWVST